ncbi:MAG: GGDEF domain-containing protein [Rubrivivax sp.]
MRYPQTKDETVALVRQVLAAAGQHDVALNPVTFAVLFEHAAGVNPRLSEALADCLRQSARLGDEAMHRLHRDHVAEISLAQAERIQGDMQRVMTDIAQSAARTGEAAGAFGERLAGLSGALAEPGHAGLGQQIDAARAGTEAMRDSVLTLQQQVQAGQREIEQLRADLLRTREEATLDPLTRVLNRRGFDRQLDAMLSAPPPKGSTHCLIMLDIDHFKRVNDTHGHPIGDRVLEGLGAVLRNVPAEPGMSCARYGGEEFAILLPATTLNKALQVAENVRARTRGIRLRNRATQAVELTITVSAGIAAWRPGDDAGALVSCADAALYRSKAAGRDRVMVA